MKTLYFVYDEQEGEVEGMFDTQGTLLGTWCCNDASWRDEYFSGFMEQLGFKVVYSTQAKLVKKLRKAWAE